MITLEQFQLKSAEILARNICLTDLSLTSLDQEHDDRCRQSLNSLYSFLILERNDGNIGDRKHSAFNFLQCSRSKNFQAQLDVEYIEKMEASNRSRPSILIEATKSRNTVCRSRLV